VSYDGVRAVHGLPLRIWRGLPKSISSLSPKTGEKKSYSSLEVYHQAAHDSQKSKKSSHWPQVTVVKDEPATDVDDAICA
jgi:hypothetical protein